MTGGKGIWALFSFLSDVLTAPDFFVLSVLTSCCQHRCPVGLVRTGLASLGFVVSGSPHSASDFSELPGSLQWRRFLETESGHRVLAALRMSLTLD